MSPEKKEPLSPEREAQEVKLKDIEIKKREQELEAYTKMDQQEIQRRELEIEDMKKGVSWSTPIDQLLAVSRAACVDNEKVMPGGEPVFKSIWEYEELEEIKHLIMKKARKL